MTEKDKSTAIRGRNQTGESREDKAGEAERDRRGRDIRREIEHAGAVGKRHVAEHDPAIKRR